MPFAKVIEKDFHLCVEYDNGIIAKLTDGISLAIVGTWGEYGYHRYNPDKDIDGFEFLVTDKSTPLFRTRDELVEYIRINEEEGRSKRHWYKFQHAIKYNELVEWREENGFDTLYKVKERERLLKLRKLLQS